MTTGIKIDKDGGTPSTPMEKAYELAIRMRQRTAGFAALVEAAFETTAYFSETEREGIALLARDIAEKAEECHQSVRALSLEPVYVYTPATAFEDEARS